jgi:glycosyltransferase involved in cell wall biosynthesis
MKMDVAVITKNSARDGGRVLERCIDSIYKEIPVNNLIVVDGHSTDGTVDVLNGFDEKHGNARIFSDGGTRATARQKCIEHVETERFAFVDSDAVLCKSWFEKVMKHMEKGVGAVWGVNFDVIPNFNGSFFYNLCWQVSRKSFEIRGGMHDTMIRRDAVEGISIPHYLHSYEDAFIIDFIRNRGYKVVIADDAYCVHLRPPSDWSMKAMLKDAYGRVKYGLAYSHKLEDPWFYPVNMLHGLMQFGMMRKNYSHARNQG